MKAIGQKECLHHANQYLRTVEQGEEVAINHGHPLFEDDSHSQGQPVGHSGLC